jgi:hypothetical protein
MARPMMEFGPLSAVIVSTMSTLATPEASAKMLP